MFKGQKRFTSISDKTTSPVGKSYTAILWVLKISISLEYRLFSHNLKILVKYSHNSGFEFFYFVPKFF